MNKTYVIAEIGINHNGDIDLAKQLIDKAKQSDLYKKVIEKFPDAELVDVKFNNKEEEND